MVVWLKLKIRLRSIAPVLLLLAGIGLPRLSMAQSQEVGLTLGGILSQTRTPSASLPFTLNSGLALQADYEYRLSDARVASLYLGVHLLANPQRQIQSGNQALTRDVATLYITPGLMLKLFPHAHWTPWVTAGAGYADYEQSTTVLNGLPNSAPRQLARGAFTYGCGVDVAVWRSFAVRGEVRDFYTGTPAYGVPVSSGQHNVVLGGGVVFRFGKK